jgi:methylmalonyl-CoA/ethylmalonyl-CoA epimerase
MYGKIHHLGIAVRSLAQTIRFYRDVLGFDLEGEVDWSQMGLKAAIFTVGETKLEFIEPVNPKGELAQSVGDFAESRDGIVHHLAFTVGNMDAEVRRLKSKGVRMLTQDPLETEGGRVIWLAKDTVTGYLVELCSDDYKIT